MAPQGDWASQFGAFGQIGLMAGMKTEGNGYVYVKATSWSGADVNDRLAVGLDEQPGLHHRQRRGLSPKSR